MKYEVVFKTKCILCYLRLKSLLYSSGNLYKQLYKIVEIIIINSTYMWIDGVWTQFLRPYDTHNLHVVMYNMIWTFYHC